MGGELLGPDVQIDGASIDSRSVRPGQLFVPIVAERDGHDFIKSALDGGATAYLSSRVDPVGGTAIRVADTALALADLGRAVRARVPDRVVGITGSVENHVKRLALLTQQSGLDGVVCSAQEANVLKQLCGKDFLLVTPGIRLPEDASNDQTRICTPKDAIANGSDYLVIGRSITAAANPTAKLHYILDTLK